MKKCLIPIITVCLIITSFIVRQYYLNNRVIGYDSYIMYGYDKNVLKLDNDSDGIEGNEILHELLSGFYKWQQLPITEHFKNKFKNRKNILNEIDGIETLYVDNENNDNENVIVVCADKKQNIFQKHFSFPITIECYFKYKMKDDKLDDLELVKKRYTDSTTGNLIKELNID